MASIGWHRCQVPWFAASPVRLDVKYDQRPAAAPAYRTCHSPGWPRRRRTDRRTYQRRGQPGFKYHGRIWSLSWAGSLASCDEVVLSLGCAPALCSVADGPGVALVATVANDAGADLLEDPGPRTRPAERRRAARGGTGGRPPHAASGGGRRTTAGTTAMGGDLGEGSRTAVARQRWRRRPVICGGGPITRVEVEHAVEPAALVDAVLAAVGV